MSERTAPTTAVEPRTFAEWLEEQCHHAALVEVADAVRNSPAWAISSVRFSAFMEVREAWRRYESALRAAAPVEPPTVEEPDKSSPKLTERWRLPRLKMPPSPFGPEYDLECWTIHEGRVLVGTVGHVTDLARGGSQLEVTLAQNLADMARVVIKLRAEASAGEAAGLTAAEIEHRLRLEWWTGHGCQFRAIYGDDGEMQCSACLVDFKRAPLATLEAHVHTKRQERIASAVAGRAAWPVGVCDCQGERVSMRQVHGPRASAVECAKCRRDFGCANDLMVLRAERARLDK